MISRDELLEKLEKLNINSQIYEVKPFMIEGDPERWHEEADKLLLEYIGDSEITDLFEKIEKWYA